MSGWEDILKQAEQAIAEEYPEANIVAIDLEGSNVVIYTKSMESFADNPEGIRRIAQKIRRRIIVRPDPSILLSEEEATKIIHELVPKEAGITNIYFDHINCEVTIEAEAPGIVIGKEASLLNEIKKRIKWAPKVVRSPPIYSRTVKEIREFYNIEEIKKSRKEFLREVGKKLNRPPLGGENWVRVVALGGYREVGRSSTLIMTRNSKVLVDCGIDVAMIDSDEPWAGAPYLYIPEVWPLETIDAVVVTHAHLDHSGLVPLLFKLGYKGPVYMTPPTRDLAALLQLDYIKVAYSEGKKVPYESKHIKEMLKYTITLNYGETTDITPDIKLTFHNAGHILGSTICHFHIGEGLYNLVITGDIKFENTWLFNAAINKFPRVEGLIIESTYGGKNDIQPSRAEASKELSEVVKRTIERGGKVLIPVFAVGRSQEVMIVLEEYIRKGELPKIDVFLDGMIWEATAIHAAYPEYLNKALRDLIFHKNENPFLSDIFRRVESSERREEVIESPDPLVVLATSGMMNGGPVLEYFRHWADDPKNTLIFVGYQAEGTLGRKIQSGLKKWLTTERGQPIEVNINLEVVTIDGFSGHSDRRQLINYIASMNPKPEKIITFHGEEDKCIELATGLYKRYGIETVAMRNLDTIRLK